jgi:hypothetical protein
MVAGSVYGQVFQTAYITNDMDEAVRVFADRFGVPDFLRSGPRELAPSDIAPMRVEIALAFVGESMIEIIQPLGLNDSLYRQVLPESGFALVFHHIAHRLHSDAEWDAMLRSAEARGHPIAMQGEASNTRFLYIDTRASLGHFIEYLYYMDPANSSLPRIPQNLPPR